jgi:hypothetical protein
VTGAGWVGDVICLKNLKSQKRDREGRKDVSIFITISVGRSFAFGGVMTKASG